MAFNVYNFYTYGLAFAPKCDEYLLRFNSDGLQTVNKYFIGLAVRVYNCILLRILKLPQQKFKVDEKATLIREAYYSVQE